MHLKARFLLAILGGALSAAPAMAAIPQLGFAGDVQIGSNYIDFGQFPSGAPYAPAPGYGTFEISLVNPGAFSTAGVTTGELGMIQSLNEGTGAITLPSPFITFDTGGSNLQLIATNVPPGTVGPFVVTQTPDGAVASFNVEGYVVDANTKVKQSNFTATFAATFDGETLPDLLASLPINTPYTATVSLTPLPEPGSLALLGAAALGLVVRRRRA